MLCLALSWFLGIESRVSQHCFWFINISPLKITRTEPTCIKYGTYTNEDTKSFLVVEYYYIYQLSQYNSIYLSLPKETSKNREKKQYCFDIWIRQSCFVIVAIKNCSNYNLVPAFGNWSHSHPIYEVNHLQRMLKLSPFYLGAILHTLNQICDPWCS